MMTISGVAGSERKVQARPLGGNQQEDSLSKSIQQQIANARERLQGLSENQDMTPEAKMKKRQELQQEITSLEQQLRQHQIQKRKEQRSQGSMEDMLGGSPKTAAKKPGKGGTGMSQASMEAMISADTSMKQARAQGSVVTRMEGQAGVLRGEIQQDKRRGIDVRQKEEELAGLEQRTQELTGQQISTLAEASQELKEASKADSQAKDTEETAERAGRSGKADPKAQEEGQAAGAAEGTAVSETSATQEAAPLPAEYHPVDIRL